MIPTSRHSDQAVALSSLETPARARFHREIWMLVGAYSALYILAAMMVNTYVLTPDVIDASIAAQGMPDLGSQGEAIRGKWRMVGYLITPVYVLIKIAFSAVCLIVGFEWVEWDVSFADCFRVAAHSEVVWVVATVVHLLSLLFFVEIASVSDITGSYPLSALQLVDLSGDQWWATYLLKSLNVFELMYVAILVFYAVRLLDLPGKDVTSVVVVSYGGGMTLLVSTMTFVLMAVS